MFSFPHIGETSSLLSAVAWAVATILFTAPSRLMRAEAMNLFKTTFAAILLVLTLILLRGQDAFVGINQRELLYLIASGILGISIADTFYFVCLRKIGAWRTLVLSCMTPPFTVVLSALILRDPSTLTNWAGMGVILVGVVIVTVSGRRRGKDGLAFTRSGMAFAVAASAAVALGIVIAKRGMVETGALEASTYRIVAAIFGILLIEVVRGTAALTIRQTLNPPRARQLLAGSFAGTYIAYFLFIAGIKYAHPGVVMALAATAPAFGIPLSALVLKERVPPAAIAGTAIALAGVALLFLL